MGVSKKSFRCCAPILSDLGVEGEASEREKAEKKKTKDI